MKISDKTVVITMLQYHPDAPSGSARLAYDQAEYLAARGHQVWILTQDDTGVAPEYAFLNDIHVLRYPRPRLPTLDPRRAHVHGGLIRDLVERYFGDGHVDLLHGHSILEYDAAQAFFGGGVRKCYSVHSPVYLEKRAESRDSGLADRIGLRLSGRLLHGRESRCVHGADVVTAFSDYSRGLIKEVYGDEIGQRTEVIPGWVDMQRFNIVEDRSAAKRALGWPDDVPILFTLRRLVPRMGLDRLLKALHVVGLRGFEFRAVIAGEGRLRPVLEQMSRDLGLLGRVSFPGRISDDLLPLMYGAADVFVLPTAELECFGLIALESLACGRPVLATPVGAIPEVIGRFEPAWLAQDATADSLAEHLIRFLAGRLPYHEPSSLRGTVTHSFDKETTLKRLVEVVLDGEHSRSCASD
jgi:glycosyltransferase involved in cell wall biosynthesis